MSQSIASRTKKRRMSPESAAEALKTSTRNPAAQARHMEAIEHGMHAAWVLDALTQHARGDNPTFRPPAQAAPGSLLAAAYAYAAAIHAKATPALAAAKRRLRTTEAQWAAFVRDILADPPAGMGHVADFLVHDWLDSMDTFLKETRTSACGSRSARASSKARAPPLPQVLQDAFAIIFHDHHYHTEHDISLLFRSLQFLSAKYTASASLVDRMWAEFKGSVAFLYDTAKKNETAERYQHIGTPFVSTEDDSREQLFNLRALVERNVSVSRVAADERARLQDLGAFLRQYPAVVAVDRKKYALSTAYFHLMHLTKHLLDAYMAFLAGRRITAYKRAAEEVFAAFESAMAGDAAWWLLQKNGECVDYDGWLAGIETVEGDADVPAEFVPMVAKLKQALRTAADKARRNTRVLTKHRKAVLDDAIELIHEFVDDDETEPVDVNQANIFICYYLYDTMEVTDNDDDPHEKYTYADIMYMLSVNRQVIPAGAWVTFAQWSAALQAFQQGVAPPFGAGLRQGGVGASRLACGRPAKSFGCQKRYQNGKAFTRSHGRAPAAGPHLGVAQPKKTVTR